MVQLGEMQFGRYVYDRFGIEYGIMGGFHALHADSPPPLILYTMQVLVPATIAPTEQSRMWALVAEILFHGRPICKHDIVSIQTGYAGENRKFPVTMNGIARFENIQFDAFGMYTVRLSLDRDTVMAEKEFYVGPLESSIAHVSRVGGTGVGAAPPEQ